ncbi:hypothetical protein CVV26_02780 [Candidatus Kuenenbacteria bacterium HGW-Kuenenbacteria-1]|uniref:Uncharacterized protein n=1 Tax=Candidatus Kuenenbacteria bacterium HGW-Kuenenbacteria-1 TaxID=2013812 RepID=A0A2N1UN05_9BACT|nr:MAG: hypothetical protein CVV26_02780 [Candidatus Kuenenbacteria bacterium HGW-Kuenenbacteria-1]
MEKRYSKAQYDSFAERRIKERQAREQEKRNRETTKDKDITPINEAPAENSYQVVANTPKNSQSSGTYTGEGGEYKITMEASTGSSLDKEEELLEEEILKFIYQLSDEGKSFDEINSAVLEKLSIPLMSKNEIKEILESRDIEKYPVKTLDETLEVDETLDKALEVDETSDETSDKTPIEKTPADKETLDSLKAKMVTQEQKTKEQTQVIDDQAWKINQLKSIINEQTNETKMDWETIDEQKEKIARLELIIDEMRNKVEEKLEEVKKESPKKGKFIKIALRSLAVLGAIISCISVFGWSHAMNQRDEAKEKLVTAQEKIEKSSTEIKNLEQTKKTTETTLENTQKDLEIENKKVAKLTDELSKRPTEKDKLKLTTDLETAKEKLANLKEKLAKQAKELQQAINSQKGLQVIAAETPKEDIIVTTNKTGTMTIGTKTETATPTVKTTGTETVTPTVEAVIPPVKTTGTETATPIVKGTETETATPTVKGTETETVTNSKELNKIVDEIYGDKYQKPEWGNVKDLPAQAILDLKVGTINASYEKLPEFGPVDGKTFDWSEKTNCVALHKTLQELKSKGFTPAPNETVEAFINRATTPLEIKMTAEEIQAHEQEVAKTMHKNEIVKTLEMARTGGKSFFGKLLTSQVPERFLDLNNKNCILDKLKVSDINAGKSAFLKKMEEIGAYYGKGLFTRSKSASRIYDTLITLLDTKTLDKSLQNETLRQVLIEK